MLGHPSCDALPHAQFQPVDNLRVWILRCSQDQILTLQNINQTRVAPHQRGNELDYASKYIVKAIRRRQAIANLVQ